jgi:hypothetical protein
MCPDEIKQQLRQRLDALGPAPRAELLHVLVLLTSTGPGTGEFCRFWNED